MPLSSDSIWGTRIEGVLYNFCILLIFPRLLHLYSVFSSVSTAVSSSMCFRKRWGSFLHKYDHAIFHGLQHLVSHLEEEDRGQSPTHSSRAWKYLHHHRASGFHQRATSAVLRGGNNTIRNRLASPSRSIWKAKNVNQTPESVAPGTDRSLGIIPQLQLDEDLWKRTSQVLAAFSMNVRSEVAFAGHSLSILPQAVVQEIQPGKERTLSLESQVGRDERLFLSRDTLRLGAK